MGVGGGLMCVAMHPSSHNKYINNYVEMPLFGELGGSVGIVRGFFSGVYEQYKIGKDLMKLNQPEKVINQNFSGNINDDKNNQKEETKLDESELKENLKKFVFFRNEKIIGFIRFVQDITPPVNGHYFNCNYNFKVEVHMSGMLYNQDKSIKNQIDFMMERIILLTWKNYYALIKFNAINQYKIIGSVKTSNPTINISKDSIWKAVIFYKIKE